MKTFTFARAAQAALIAAASAAQAPPPWPTSRTTSSSSSTRPCRPAPTRSSRSGSSNTKTGKPVPDAVIFATRLDMAPDAMQEMATKIVAGAGRRARHLQVQGDVRHGRPLAAFARRQGPGRDRHRREQARHHGAEMNRALITGAVAAVDRGGRHRLRRRAAAVGDAVASSSPAAAEAARAPIYYQDPDGKPFVLADAAEDAGRPRLSCRARRARRQLRRADAPATMPAPRDCGGRAQDQILPQSDGAARHLADAEEGLHGDGLHPRL